MATFPKGGFEQLPFAETSAAVSAHRLVQRHTDGHIRHAVADSDIQGVTMEAGASGTTPRIQRMKSGVIVEVQTTAAAVAVGALLTSGANGQAVTTTTAGDRVCGIALTAAPGAGGVIQMQIQQGNVNA